MTNGPIKIAEPIKIDVKVANLHTVALKKGRWNTGDSILAGGKKANIGIPGGSCMTFINSITHTPYGKEQKIVCKFELYTEKKGEFRFRFRAPNGQLMFSGEGYKKKASATNAIESIKKNVGDATIDDQS